MFINKITSKKIQHNSDLWSAAENGDLEELQKFLKVDGGCLNDEGPCGYTALMLAAKNGHTQCLHAILERGANPDVQNKEGNTALILAACWNHVDCVVLLRAKEANCEIRNRLGNGHTALSLASHYKNFDCVRLLTACDIEIKGLSNGLKEQWAREEMEKEKKRREEQKEQEEAARKRACDVVRMREARESYNQCKEDSDNGGVMATPGETTGARGIKTNHGDALYQQDARYPKYNS